MICSKCSQDKGSDGFYPSDPNWCKECRLAYTKANRHKYKDQERTYNKKRNKSGLDIESRKQWMAKRYDKLNAIKAITPCMDCGNLFPPVCMDFDHREGVTKIDDVASLLGTKKKSWNIIIEEIAKCDLVCANCHRLRTQRRRFAVSTFTSVDSSTHRSDK